MEEKWKKKYKKAKNEDFQQMSSYHNGDASYHDAMGLFEANMRNFGNESERIVPR
jgi:uncharacterized protein YozE (UPF0346 family)